MTTHEKAAAGYSIALLALIAKDLRKHRLANVRGTWEFERLRTFERELKKRKKELEL